MSIDYELEKAKNKKRQEVKWWLQEQEESSITVDGVDWHSGYESGMRLDAARRLAMEAGLTEVNFSDINNVYHTLTIPQATAVVLAVGADFQTKFAQKQAWMVAIANATTIAELPTIT